MFVKVQRCRSILTVLVHINLMVAFVSADPFFLELILTISLSAVCCVVYQSPFFPPTETLHSWELVNISDTAEIGRQECNYLFANR